MTKAFPSQTGLYKIKPKSEQSSDRWSDFQTARLQISVGQPYHEGEKFAATLEWCRPRFKGVVICVNDTLQRYNAMFELGLSDDVARQRSVAAGSDWIARNLGSVTDDPIFEIRRWNDWLADPDYLETHRAILALDKTNPDFAAAISADIERIWARRHANDPEAYSMYRRAAFQELSRVYLLEEIAVFSLMFAQETAIDIYPGSALFAAQVFQGRKVAGAPAGLGRGHFCRIDFGRNRWGPDLKIA
ncbi:tRNA-dependent cyclodipeptide synthase [Aestuariibius sp. 2305UL40-4]|uniref:tRNA-dependent cyclodipeptide synthase n=1 Tax=Aestuariibius violaceus TaxID=3234132 RepID=UPI00398F539B